MKLTVYYDGQFWVGVIEQVVDNHLRVYRYLFGPEPTDGQVLEFVLKTLPVILSQLPEGIPALPLPERRVNPKRLAREAAEEIQQRGISTRAQAALQAERELNKQMKSSLSREQREAEKARQRGLAVAKAKAKHRGH